MAKDTYKKRMKGHWTQGKGCKGDGEERQHSKREIKQALEEDEGFVRHKSKRKRNKKASLEHTIAWCKQKIQEHENAGRKSRSWTGYLYRWLEESEKEYNEYLAKEKK